MQLEILPRIQTLSYEAIEVLSVLHSRKKGARHNFFALLAQEKSGAVEIVTISFHMVITRAARGWPFFYLFSPLLNSPATANTQAAAMASAITHARPDAAHSGKIFTIHSLRTMW